MITKRPDNITFVRSFLFGYFPQIPTFAPIIYLTLSSMSTVETAVRKRTATKKITIGKLPRTSTADFQFTLPTAPRVTVPPRVSTPKAPVAPVYINAKDYLKNKYVWDADGEKIYPMVREGLAQGRKVIISIKGLNVNGGFWDTAVCKAYGEFQEELVDENIEVVDGDEVDMIYLKDMKDIRKLYYYDRELYDEIVNNVDPIIGYDEPLVDEELYPFEDRHAPYDSNAPYWKAHKFEGEE
jgi:hypothetical protein